MCYFRRIISNNNTIISNMDKIKIEGDSFSPQEISAIRTAFTPVLLLESNTPICVVILLELTLFPQQFPLLSSNIGISFPSLSKTFSSVALIVQGN